MIQNQLLNSVKSACHTCITFSQKPLMRNKKNLFFATVGLSSSPIYFSIININVASTGVVLSSCIQVWEDLLQPRHGVHHDVLPVAEAASQHNVRPIADGAGVT